LPDAEILSYYVSGKVFCEISFFIWKWYDYGTIL